ncbi:D-tyrosyl-tRNA(Tyr) deacylase [Kangiella profundi]|uniref:D-aminoacyl-tRNA deacylase n=1 Tax=Kangiella profundi TaxID=1561924 RepID=A0A2K9AH06_9GAMM|nr:D-aminoacyl-tRNA deacylase [Kangiella profundi]AUD79676.1 D-tyrosyl-tRNA(Tyr) deacylase [Kangiella profundi]GGE96377.1 D-aminoacyl-tRNA deacylase [Kangiella profundi]
MIALLQRVLESKVVVEGKTIGEIDQGLMVLLGVEKNDDQAVADKLLQRILKYRVFSDEQDKMNLSLQDVKGGLLLVPQFTLAADTQSGLRPSFSSAAPPQVGKELFEYVVGQARAHYDKVESGQFGAAMKVHLINDGPVTFQLKI